jgi:phage tail sheath gpL-like
MKTRNAWLAAAVLAAASAPAVAQQQINKRVSVAADATIEVSNVQGSVTITAWDKNEVELVAELESDKDELEFEATDRHVRIEVERPEGRSRHDEDDDASLTLRVPGGARLDIDTVSAEIGVTGVKGEQSLETVSGEIRTQAFDAPIRANAVSGDVTVTGNGGKASVITENVSGTSNVTGIRGEYHGEVVSGELNAVVAGAERLELSSVSGDINLQAELTHAARVEMGSVSGMITLKVKSPVNADFDIESFSGDIENCFGQKSRDTSKYTPGSELNFTQGKGGARVEIETLSGEISICDR